MAELSPIGAWKKGASEPGFDDGALVAATPRVREPAHVVRDGVDGRLGVAYGGEVVAQTNGEGQQNGTGTWPLMATLPPLYPEWLGDRSFLEAHGLRFPYVAGAMANGIATAELVVAMASAGMLSFFGAAGLTPDRISKGLDDIERGLGGRTATWGSNLIHAPHEPLIEAGTVDLYLRRRVHRVSASAFMALTPNIVRYAATGLSRDGAGRIHRENHVFAKISRPEVAARFLSPPPKSMLDELVRSGGITAEEAALAALLPVAEDFTVEADSGGHTDNGSLSALFPTIRGVRDQIAAERGYQRPIRVGAAGGLGDPSAVAAAFALGASYVLTGSINQSAIESGLCDDGKRMLAEVALGDVVMAPAADMFEMGVKVQVLKRGTLFGSRAKKLYELYVRHASLDDLPADERAKLERDVFKRPIDEVWEGTRAFFAERDPSEAERAEHDLKHRMALVFRWYLGLSSKWAIAGDPDRRLDYQIWCGPAMGAFNAWTRGSFLEAPEARSAPQIARNLLEGAAVITRAQQLRSYGVAMPAAAFRFSPRPLA